MPRSKVDLETDLSSMELRFLHFSRIVTLFFDYMMFLLSYF